MNTNQSDFQSLIEKIKKIEALIAGATSDGEKQAAELASQRVRDKLKQKPEVSEYTLYTSDTWHKKLLLAICRKYGLKPYRYHRQKYTTVMVRAEDDFLNNVVWKEYLEYSKLLEALVDDITNDVIAKIHAHSDEDIVPKQLK